jgi:hypothetical protein
MVTDSSVDVQPSEGRRLDAVKRWLENSCSEEVDSEIKAAKSRNENYAALLAAVS